MSADLKALLVDPSLFTGPYDRALSKGLAANGVDVCWATRGLRTGEEDMLGDEQVEPLFYPLTDGERHRASPAWRALKGIEHLRGLARLRRLAAEGHFDIVHFQWSPLPLFDRIAINRIAPHRPVVLTVHDTVPFNGKPLSSLQTDGLDALFRSLNHLIVHSDIGRQALIRRGVRADRVTVIPHGLLPLPPSDPEPRPDDGRWRIVLFGKLQHYKGVDILIEALGLLEAEQRQHLEVVVAGEPLIELDQLYARVRALGLGNSITFRPYRLSEMEASALLRSADAFIFPYRSIEASGVLHLVADLGRWIIASAIGTFADLLPPGAGTLVPAGEPRALAHQITASIGRRPTQRPAADVPDWSSIGAATRSVYERLIERRSNHKMPFAA